MMAAFKHDLKLIFKTIDFGDWGELGQSFGSDAVGWAITIRPQQWDTQLKGSLLTHERLL